VTQKSITRGERCEYKSPWTVHAWYASGHGRKIPTHVKSVIVAEQELELSGKVADSARHEAKEDRSWSTDVTRAWGDGDEASDSTRAETYDGPLSLETPVPKHPSETTGGGSQL